MQVPPRAMRSLNFLSNFEVLRGFPITKMCQAAKSDSAFLITTIFPAMATQIAIFIAHSSAMSTTCPRLAKSHPMTFGQLIKHSLPWRFASTALMQFRIFLSFMEFLVVSSMDAGDMEMSCGWCKLNLTDVKKAAKSGKDVQLRLKGGTPLHPMSIRG